MKHERLNGDDARAIQHAIEGLQNEGISVVTWGMLATKWQAFAGSVGTYRMTIYDYADDLSVRDIIARLLAALPENVASKLEAQVVQSDERFKEQTEYVEKVLPGGSQAAPWWWHRVPKEPSGELRDDLEAEGIL